MSIHVKSKLYNIVSSVSMKIILTMLLMILPLNVIVLIYTYNMQEGMIELKPSETCGILYAVDL